MKITLQNLGRRFNQEWIFRKLDYTFFSSKKYAILGPNGSGKSTLIKVLSGQLTPSDGQIDYTLGDISIPVDNMYTHVAIAAPYVELIEEFTLRELIDFHFKFKGYLPTFDKAKVVDLLGLKKALDKPIRFYSSGMKQRVKLALACCSHSDILFLDEPCSNLDAVGEAWYRRLVELTTANGRLLIIGSNQEKEYDFCDETLLITDFK
ncbi:ABC transporter ATP-binding protein [Sphingobacterium sp. Mn56C]|uniref:ABC transporter ATP-binding protein n=1 Tax=Sphingobacterium sp. Mn56C TaxID=3395261 RepID=UPI003BC71831